MDAVLEAPTTNPLDCALTAFKETRGDDDFAEFHRLSYRHLESCLSKHDSMRQHKDDLLQEIYFKIIRSIDSYDPSQSALNWILRITNNMVIDFWRAAPVQLDGVRQLDVPHDDDGPEEQTIESETVEMLQACLRHLPDDQQQMIQVVYFEGRDLRSAADIMGMSKSTLRRHLAKATATLRSMMDVDRNQDFVSLTNLFS